MLNGRGWVGYYYIQGDITKFLLVRLTQKFVRLDYILGRCS